MRDPSLYTWRHVQADLSLDAEHWGLRSASSSRDAEELLREGDMWVDHTTGCRWGRRYAAELDRRCRPSLRATNAPYRVNETSIKIKQQWYDLDRAVDSTGATLDFMLSSTRDADVAEHFFRQVRRAPQTLMPRVITVDKPVAYPPVCEALHQESTRQETCVLRQGTYVNRVVEQEHRCVRCLVNSGLGCGAFATAQRTRPGYEGRHMIRQGQLEGMTRGDVLAPNQVINQLFG